jgi:sec-independent protein translocase protein TatB
MFNIGFWEFALIGIITLIVVGPEKIPAVAKKAGSYAGKIKKIIDKVKFDIENEINTETIEKNLSIDYNKEEIKENFENAKNTFEDIKKDFKKD